MSQYVIERPHISTLLGRNFSGAVHAPGDSGYDEQRRSLHPIDPRPLLVAEAARASDVQAAVLAARAGGIPFAVQATGHGTRVPSDGGLLLKTSGMAAVLVDPDRRIARVGPGARWSQVLEAAAPFGLAPLSGSHTSVGVTGYTLGGGMGWLARRYGFAADSVVRAEVVTADGRRVIATADRNPDLFWALRGGGANFGVVTSLDFRLYPVAQVHAGTAYFPIERAAETLAFYRDWAAAAPDELSTAVLLTDLPDSPDVPEPVRGKRVVAIKAMYAGHADDARCAIRPLWAAAGQVLHDGLRTTRYADASMGGTAARHFDYYEDLPDALIDTLVAAPVTTVEIRHWAGAIARPGPNAGPAGHRSAQFSVILDTWAPNVARALRPHGMGGSFLNFLARPEKTATAYTPENYRRLTQIKSVYDPDNFFHVNHNIQP